MIKSVPGANPAPPRRIKITSYARFLLLGIVAAFVLAVLLVNFVLLPWHVSIGREAIIPEVAGMGQEEAIKLLKSKGFATGDVRYVADTLIPTGQVVESRPKAGSTVKVGRVVALDISSGKEKTKVPQVARLPANRAEAAIENAGLRVGEVIIVNSSKVPDGQVVSTTPSAGQQVTKGTAVNLFVSKGAEGAVEMPSVKGQPIERVKDILLNLDLTLVPPTQAASPQPTGTVLSQDPAEGTEVQSGDTVRLTISKQTVAEKPADQGKKPVPTKDVKKPVETPKKTEPPKPNTKQPGTVKPTVKTK